MRREFCAASMLPPSFTMNTPDKAFTSWSWVDSWVDSSAEAAAAARATRARPKLRQHQQEM